jgi:hypothetical protein
MPAWGYQLSDPRPKGAGNYLRSLLVKQDSYFARNLSKGIDS